MNLQTTLMDISITQSLSNISMMFDTAELLVVEEVDFKISVIGEEVQVDLKLSIDGESAKRLTGSAIRGAANISLGAQTLRLRNLPSRFAPLLKRLRDGEGFDKLLDEGVPFPLLLDLRHFALV